MPRATRAGAAQVAERIQATLATVPLIGPDGRPWPAPPVSQGVACFPDHATSAALLADVAAQALSTAKAPRRNSIVAARAEPPNGLSDVGERSLEVRS